MSLYTIATPERGNGLISEELSHIFQYGVIVVSLIISFMRFNWTNGLIRLGSYPLYTAIFPSRVATACISIDGKKRDGLDMASFSQNTLLSVLEAATESMLPLIPVLYDCALM